jgi:hypothetical protein
MVRLHLQMEVTWPACATSALYYWIIFTSLETKASLCRIVLLDFVHRLNYKIKI